MVIAEAHWLNDYGERYWYLKSDPTITAHRPYYWTERIIYLQEQTVYKTENGRLTTSDRKVLGKNEFNHPTTYTEFENDLWIPIDNFDKYIQNVLLPLYRKRKLNQIHKYEK